MSFARWTACWTAALAVLLTAAAPAAAATNALGWGSNFAGMLGDGSTADSPTASSASTPVPVTNGAMPAGVSIVSVAPGSRFTVAAGSDGKAYSWGRNCDGELGIGTDDACATWPPTRHASPEAVALPAGVEVVDVAAGYDHGVAVGSDGKLYSWGLNCSGQLATGSVDACENSFVGPAHPTPAASVAGEVPSGVKIVSAEGNQSNTVALGSDGKAYVAGYSGSSTPDGRLRAVQGELPAGVTITQIAAGRNRLIALGSDGNVYGLSTSYRPPLLFAHERGAIPEAVTIVRIASGYGTLYAVGDDGEVYAWGDGESGQLGNGGTANATVPVKVDDSGALSGVDIVDVAAAARTAAALGADGKAYTWGSGSSGQLGNGTSGSGARSTVPVAVSLPAGARLSALAASGSDSDSFFALSLSRLTVAKDGTGSGSVTDSATPRRVDCGTRCTADFGPGQIVTLTATPASESTFIGWGGACTGRATCTVTMDQARSVTATFRTGNPLVVARGGSGSGTVTDDWGQIDCGTSCVGAYPTWGEQGMTGPVNRVRLTATPAAGSTFSHWVGACAAPYVSSGPYCELDTSSALETTAVFTARRTLTVSRSGSGSGLVRETSWYYALDCGSTCSATYDEGAVVTLEAYGYAGATFDGWGGACSGTGPCTVTMSQARSVTASFTAPPDYVPPTQQQQQPPPNWSGPPPGWSPPPPAGTTATPSSPGATQPGTTTPTVKKKKARRCYKRKGGKRVRVACKKAKKKKATKKRRRS